MQRLTIDQHPLKVLVVDDDSHITSMLRECLEVEGYSVREALDGRQALDHVRQHKFDVLIVDLLIPQMNGIEVIERARAVLPRAKIIAISGGGGRGPDMLLEVSQKLGADEALTKPFYPDDLVRLVRALLSSQ